MVLNAPRLHIAPCASLGRTVARRGLPHSIEPSTNVPAAEDVGP